MEIKSNTSQSRRPTLQQVIEDAIEFPFADYGLAKLEGVLTSVGKNWDFEV